MGAISSLCGDLVGGFCGAGVKSEGLDSLKILSSSYLYLALVYSTMIMILIMHKIGSSGGVITLVRSEEGS